MSYFTGHGAPCVQFQRRSMQYQSAIRLHNVTRLPARCLPPRKVQSSQLSAFRKSEAPAASPPEASLIIAPAPTTVKLADGTTVTLVDPAPRVPATQTASQTAITLPGLLGVLALSSTTLLAAAATCFMLYVRPILQSMSVTLSEMEQAAKDMQEAADHVEATSQLLQSQLPATLTSVQAAAEEAAELAGTINNAARMLTPTRLLRRTDSSGSSSSTNGTADPSSSKQGSEAAAAADGLMQSTSSLLEGFKELGLSLSSNSNSSVASVIPHLQTLTAMPSGLTDLLSQFDDVEGSSSGSSIASGISRSSGSPRSVWDAVALTLTSAKVSEKTLARLRADLKAAATVLGVLLDPTAAAGSSGDDSSKQQVDELPGVTTTPAADAAATSAAPSTANDPAAAAAAVSGEGGLSSIDGRIRIAAGVRISGAAPVMRSLSEDDIEAALGATNNTSNGNTSSNYSSSSSSTSDKDPGAAAEVSNSSSDAGSAEHVGGEAAAAAAEPAEAAEPAAALEAAEPAVDSSDHSSSQTSRRRRKSRRIEEDEWGLPTVVEASESFTSSSSSSTDIVQQDPTVTANGTAPGVPAVSAVAAAASVSPAQQQSTLSSPAAAAARKLYQGTGSSSSSSSRRGWVYDSSDDEEDYAGYRVANRQGVVNRHDSVRTNSGSQSSAAASSSNVFAGYETCQDSLLHCDARPDDGITWTQLNQDSGLMQRVFCDNQEGILQHSITRQQQQSAVIPEPHRQL